MRCEWCERPIKLYPNGYAHKWDGGTLCIRGAQVHDVKPKEKA